MAQSGQTEFQGINLDISVSPEQVRNFLRVMAMMAVPKDGDIYDVLPKNGIRPLAYNKNEGISGYIGFLSLDDSYVDDDTEEIYFGISSVNPLADIEQDDDIGMYLGGMAILGTYLLTEDNESFLVVDLASNQDAYAIYLTLMGTSPNLTIPIWALAGDNFLYLDYEADWSGGMEVNAIRATEYTGFNADETAAMRLTASEVPEWRKLPNATGLAMNMDVANKMLALSMSTGIITKGKPSSLEPLCWQIQFGTEAILRVYLNIHEINHKRLGKYQLNLGQGHQAIFFRDGIVEGSAAGAGGPGASATLTINNVSADFWENWLDSSPSGAIFNGELRIIGEDEWRAGYLEWDVAWEFKFLYSEAIATDIVADIRLTSMTIIIADVVIAAGVVTFPAGSDTYLNPLFSYAFEYDNADYTLTWDPANGYWLSDLDTLDTKEIMVTIPIMSYDTLEFSQTYQPDEESITTAEAELGDIFLWDNQIYPDKVYYYRIVLKWRDLICHPDGVDQSLVTADIYQKDPLDEPRLPKLYGIYALSNYAMDEYGNQSADASLDTAAESRYCGIYGRNWQCWLNDIGHELSIYPAGTELTIYYPPAMEKVLLSSADNGIANYVELLQTENTITFDLTPQTLGALAAETLYATATITADDGKSALVLRYERAGISGNGYTVILDHDPDGTLTIYEPIDDIISIGVNTPGTTTLEEIKDAILAETTINHNLVPSWAVLEAGGNDQITYPMTVVLSGGGNQKIITNKYPARTVREVFLHPGYVFNNTFRKYPISVAGIYAVYLSANYRELSDYVNVIPIESDDGIQLYVALYFGEAMARYKMVSDIAPDDTQYTDTDLQVTQAYVEIETSGAEKLGIVALEPGWIGSTITLTLREIDESEWNVKYGYDNGVDHIYEEDVNARTITISTKIVDKIAKELDTDEIQTLAAATELITFDYAGGKETIETDKYYQLSGGGGTDTMLIHSNGYMLGLEHEGAGVFGLTRFDGQTERWLFKDAYVDLLAYQLEQIKLGTLNDLYEYSTTEAEPITTEAVVENAWKLKADSSALSDIIADRQALQLFNYITVENREIAVLAVEDDIALDGTLTITTDDEGSRVIRRAILNYGNPVFYIKDIFYSADAEEESVGKSMLYYGNYKPRITVWMPNIETWGRDLVPYYILRLVYSMSRAL